MKKLENKIPKNIIQSKKFSALSDIIYSETVSKDDFSKINSNNVEIINKTNNKDYKTVTYRLKKFTIAENDIIFCHLDSLPELFFQLQKITKLSNLILITNQTDQAIDNSLYSKKPKCIKIWFSTNTTIESEDLRPIPLGIANDYAKKNLSLESFNNIPKKSYKKSSMYINFRESTNYKERSKLIRIFQNYDWVNISPANLDNSEYHDDLANNTFVLCPWGNGVDTHRFWEVLYSGSIPITKYHPTYKTAEKLPVLFVESYSQINQKLLDSFISKIDFTKQEYEQLDMIYWENKVFENKINSNTNEYVDILETKEETQLFVKNYVKRKNVAKKKKKIKYYTNKMYKIPNKLFK